MLVLCILATAWAVALLPPWFRRRSESRPAASILSFRQQLSTLQRTTPAGRAAHFERARGELRRRPGVMTLSAARRRRRDVLSTLAATTGLTSVMALVLGGVAVAAFAVMVGFLSGYVSLLIRAHKRSIQRVAKVSYLVPQQSQQPEPVLLMRRSASN